MFGRGLLGAILSLMFLTGRFADFYSAGGVICGVASLLLVDFLLSGFSIVSGYLIRYVIFSPFPRRNPRMVAQCKHPSALHPGLSQRELMWTCNGRVWARAQGAMRGGRAGATVERNGAAVKWVGVVVEWNGAAVERNSTTVKRNGRGEDTDKDSGQGYRQGQRTRTRDKDGE